MENLNDDCLLNIFNYLGLIDKISVTCACRRFADVICQLIGKEVVDLARSLESSSPADLTQFLSICGRFIRRVKMDPVCISSLLDLPPIPDCSAPFVKHCFSSSLEEVEIVSVCYDFVWDKLESFLENCTNLRVVTLRRFSPGEERRFNSLHDIESLCIWGSPISGQCLLGSTNLVDLSLAFCPKINPRYFKYILENNKNLKRLNIRRCISLKNSNIGQALGKHQNIERISIDITFFEVSSVLPEIPSLKQIAIFDDYSLWSQYNPPRADLFKSVLKQVSDDHLHTLKSLELHSWDFSLITDWPPFQSLANLKLINARGLTDGLLKEIGETCRLLERADLRASMNHVTDEGLLDFVRASTNLSYLNLGCNARYSQKFIFKIGEVRRDMDITDPLTIAYNRWMFPEDWVTQDDDPRKSLRLISSENPNDLDWDCMRLDYFG